MVSVTEVNALLLLILTKAIPPLSAASINEWHEVFLKAKSVATIFDKKLFKLGDLI